MKVEIASMILAGITAVAATLADGHICIDPVTALMLFAYMMRDYRNGKTSKPDAEKDKKK